jgi:VCBS repeat-containing protein
MLIDAIAEHGGPGYIYVEIPPATACSTGGEPGGTIRNGFFYNPDRVSLVAGGLSILNDPAFDGSRKPLVGSFTFNGEEVTLVNVHLTARLGGPPAWGADQPAADAGDDARTAQATAVRGYVNDALATDPSLKLGVLGDFNGFWFENSVAALEAGGVMTDLYRLLPEAERYSARFDGNLQGIDHIVATGSLLDGASFDIVHRNAEQPFFVTVGSDHDPVIARFFIEHPNEAPVGAADAVAVLEGGTSANLWDLLLGNDNDPDPEDVLAIAAVDGSGTLGSLVFDPETQTLVYVADGAAFDSLAPGQTAVDSFTYTVTDPDGLTGSATVQVTVTGVGAGMSRNGGNGDDALQGTAAEDQLSGGNGDDALAGGDGHDRLTGGNHDDTLIGGAGNDRLDGGNHDDLLLGGTGRDTLIGGNHDDRLFGGAGDDLLNGGNQSDWLDGGAGNDLLTGGNQSDVFAFTDLGGVDLVTDFRRGQDKIDLNGIDAVAGNAGHDAFSWIGASAFSGTAGELRSSGEGGSFFLAGDVDGDGLADFTIETHLLIGPSDILFGAPPSGPVELLFDQPLV